MIRFILTLPLSFVPHSFQLSLSPPDRLVNNISRAGLRAFVVDNPCFPTNLFNGAYRLLTAFLLLFGVGCSDDAFHQSSSPTYFDQPAEWIREVRLETPQINLGIGIEGGGYGLSWTHPEGAEYFVLERDILPTFLTASLTYIGPDRLYNLGDASEYPFTCYYRVRAENRFFVSKWSNIVGFP